jgi:hypothetical protein
VILGTLKSDPTVLNGYMPLLGDIFELLDWVMLGNSTTGDTSFDSTGIDLFGALALNTQLFASNAIIVVPEHFYSSWASLLAYCAGVALVNGDLSALGWRIESQIRRL